MKVKMLATRVTARFVIYNPAPEALEADPEVAGAILYWPRPVAKDQAPPGEKHPEYLYLDVQAG